MSKILAFDLATRTGWAQLDVVGVFEGWDSGVHDLLDADGAYWDERLEEFRGWATEVLSRSKPDLVVVEEPQFMKSRDAARVCYSLHHLLSDVVANHKYRQLDISPSRLKKWATGSGKAKKPAMLAAARKLTERNYAIPVRDHNEADAILLAAYGRKELGL